MMVLLEECYQMFYELLTQYKPEQLFVIIGWSSPERKDFFTIVNGKQYIQMSIKV